MSLFINDGYLNNTRYHLQHREISGTSHSSYHLQQVTQTLHTAVIIYHNKQLDTKFSTHKLAMCKGYSEIHQACSHLKRYVVTEPCVYGITEQGQCAGNRSEVLYIKDISWPPLCLHCYQCKERDIIERYGQEIQSLGAMIESLKWKRRAEPEASVRADMRAQVSLLEEKLGDARDEKSEQLNEFRTL